MAGQNDAPKTASCASKPGGRPHLTGSGGIELRRKLRRRPNAGPVRDGPTRRWRCSWRWRRDFEHREGLAPSHAFEVCDPVFGYIRPSPLARLDLHTETGPNVGEPP